jgi:hypothetical protein
MLSATSSPMVSPLLMGGVEMYEGVGPDHALAEAAKDRLLYTLVLVPDEAAHLRAVVVYQFVA